MRCVRREHEKFSANVLDYEAFLGRLRSNKGIDTLLITGNYASDWVTEDFIKALGKGAERSVILIDTLPTALTDRAAVVIPGATWAEKAGTFENGNNRLQAFDRAIKPIDYCKSEAQIALDLEADRTGEEPRVYDAAQTRRTMADVHDLSEFVNDVHLPPEAEKVESDMQMVEI